jgi:hypothetical protein
LLLSSIVEGGGYIDSILELESKNHYDYIQECYLLKQVLRQKVFTFKMSINSMGSGVNLVTRMQLAGDFKGFMVDNT